jgi:hypothetical protein
MKLYSERSYTMKKLEIFKLGVEVIVGIGVGMIAGSAIGMVPVTGGILAKIATKAGAIALESMVVDKTTEYVEERINDVENKMKEMINKIEQKTE